MPHTKPAATSRIIAFDYLRGFFIAVVIIDHLYRWPSLLALFTGQGWLWMTAAEGFFIISGLLLGYIRGYKERDIPLRAVARKLVRRAGLLYVWSVGLTIIFAALCWQATDRAGLIPYVAIQPGDWMGLVWQALTQQYTFIWTHFLKLYWIVLLLATGVIFLLRKRLWWLAGLASVCAWLVGYIYAIEWLQWQILFFVPAIVGYYLDPLRNWLARHPGMAARLRYGIIGLTLVTIAASVFFTFYTPLSDSLNTAIAALTAREPLTFPRLIISAVWFTGLFCLFQLLTPWLGRWLHWLLISFGTRSLSAYIIHGFILFTIQVIAPLSSNLLLNTALGVAAILATWSLLQLSFVRRIIPT